MRNTAATVILTACAVLALLSASGQPTQAFDWRGNVGTAGFIYHVGNTDDWVKGLPNPKPATQQGWDHELARKTHYVFEGTNEWEKRVNFQRALDAALKDGWVVTNVDPNGLSACMVHPKLDLPVKALIPTKAPWKLK